jgi:hypothetical protein
VVDGALLSTLARRKVTVPAADAVVHRESTKASIKPIDRIFLFIIDLLIQPLGLV